MEAAASYILRLVCGAVISAVILSIGGDSSIRRMLCGLFMAFLAISPLRDIDLADIPNSLDSFTSSAEAAAQDGVDMASEAILDIIKTESETYILDKAEELGLEVEVSVLVDSQTQLPVAVTITGNAGPYQKQVLNDYIRENLGIEEGDQQWES